MQRRRRSPPIICHLCTKVNSGTHHINSWEIYTDGVKFWVLCHGCLHKPQQHKDFTTKLPLYVLEGAQILHVSAAASSETVREILQSDPRGEWTAYFPSSLAEAATSDTMPRQSQHRRRSATLRCKACNQTAAAFVQTNHGDIACTACVDFIVGGVVAGSTMRSAPVCQRWIKSDDATSRREAADAAAVADAAAAAAEHAARQTRRRTTTASNSPLQVALTSPATAPGAAAMTISQPAPPAAAAASPSAAPPPLPTPAAGAHRSSPRERSEVPFCAECGCRDISASSYVGRQDGQLLHGQCTESAPAKHRAYLHVFQTMREAHAWFTSADAKERRRQAAVEENQSGGAKAASVEMSDVAVHQRYRDKNCAHTRGDTFELVSNYCEVECDKCGDNFKSGYTCKVCTGTSQSGLPTFDFCPACFDLISPKRCAAAVRPQQPPLKRQKPRPRAATTFSPSASSNEEEAYTSGSEDDSMDGGDSTASSDNSTAESESGSCDGGPVNFMVRKLQDQSPAAKELELVRRRENASTLLRRRFWSSAAGPDAQVGDGLATAIMARYFSDLRAISTRGIVVVDLCAGIGGNLMTLIRSGFKIDLYIFVEIDEMCRAVIEDCCARFDVKCESHSDVTKSGLDSEGRILDRNLCVIPAGRWLFTVLSRFVPHTHAHRFLSFSRSLVLSF